MLKHNSDSPCMQFIKRLGISHVSTGQFWYTMFICLLFCLMVVNIEETTTQISDLNYENEPERSDDLIVNQQQPFNAETRGDQVGTEFLTPVDIFYVRSHGPVPGNILYNGSYALKVNGVVENPFNISLPALQQFTEQTSINATLMCAGNRRKELNNIKTVKGVPWGIGAIGNAEWTGIPLWQLLTMAEADLNNPKLHVEFVGHDFIEGGSRYAQSIPMYKAGTASEGGQAAAVDGFRDPKGDVLIAWAMNGQPLPVDHGYPLRAIVPGFIGARSVKWLKEINVLDHESQNKFQQRDYKLFLSNVNWDNVEPLWSVTPALTELSVQSAITEPTENSTIPRDTPVTIKGYAVSNGARIVRVDVSLNDGLTWQAADIVHQEKKGFGNRYWGWTIWALSVAKFPSPCTIVCRAWDSSSNTQPETAANIWNLRGVMNNAWHRVHIRSGQNPSRRDSAFHSRTKHI